MDRAENPVPCLVMLDLSMPGKHGHQVFARLPVIVLTSSNQESDIYRGYLLGANGDVIKPGDPDDMLRIVRTLKQDWLGDTPPAGPFVDVAAVMPPPDLKEKNGRPSAS